MNCPRCDSVQSDDAKFCTNCGSNFELDCPNCSHSIQPTDRFCAECGTPLIPAAVPAPPLGDVPGAPATAERRFVSVLFADIVGYTSLSETRDSEDIRDMLTVYFDRSRTIVERFGGTVDKFIGDAVMGIWGATVAREDDAQRAVRAALELVDMVAALGEEIEVPGLQLRAAVNSGTTSVGPGGNERGLVVGDLVNTASRLQSIADPGTVLVGPSTYEVTRSSIDFEDMGERTVKGKVEAVHAFKALRVASMVSGRVDEEVRRPPFVGREREMRLLKDGLAAVKAEQRARLISIIGEAGVGKTRLAEEFKKHIDGYTETIYWHWGRSPSYGDGLTFWALGEIVRGRAGIIENEEPVRARTRLRTMLAEFVPGQEDRDWIEPRLAGLLGLAEMPQGSQSELFAALRSFFQQLAERGPTVLVFEDLHWADAGLLEFISELVERATKHPILVLTLARTDLLDRVSDWGSQHRSSTGTRLSPLPDAAMARLVSGYIPGVGADVVDQIVTRVAGFPLYAVEVVRMLLGSGQLVEEGEKFRYDGNPAEMSIPDSLLTVIGARLDRLEPDERSWLQDGAVLGQTFMLPAIAWLRGVDPEAAADRLRPLISQEMLELEDDPRSPERGQYVFVQSLIREVAYGRLSRDDRRAKHLAVAEYFERGDDPELAGVVAGHYMGAYRATPGNDERALFVAKAVASLADAAARAADLHSHRQAMNLLDEAIKLAPPGRAAELRVQAADSADRHGEVDRGLAYLGEARRFYEEQGDTAGLRRAAAAQSALLNGHYRSAEALDAVAPIYENLADLDDVESVQVAAEAGRSYAINLRHADALAAIDGMLPVAASFGMVETILDSVITRALSLYFLDRGVEARIALRGAATEAQLCGLLSRAQRALNALAYVTQNASPREAMKTVRETLDLSRRVGDLRWIVRNSGDLAEWLTRDGCYDEALGLLDEMDSYGLFGFWQGASPELRHRIDFRRTGSVEARDQALASLAYFEGETDLQAVAFPIVEGAWIWAEAGEWDRAFDLGMSVDPEVEPNGVFVAANAAAWLRDRDKLAAILEKPVPFPRLADYVRALIAALDGSRDEVVEELNEAFKFWAPRFLGDQQAWLQASAAAVIGIDHPIGARAARHAYDWCIETGTKSLLNAWAPILPTHSADDVAAG